jgi:hypothetical protein
MPGNQVCEVRNVRYMDLGCFQKPSVSAIWL